LRLTCGHTSSSIARVVIFPRLLLEEVAELEVAGGAEEVVAEETGGADVELELEDVDELELDDVLELVAR
jgi:hypothetical protein